MGWDGGGDGGEKRRQIDRFKGQQGASAKGGSWKARCFMLTPVCGGSTWGTTRACGLRWHERGAPHVRQMRDARQGATVGGNWAPSGCGLRRPRGGPESAETAIVTYPHVAMLVHWWERMQVAHSAGVIEGEWERGCVRTFDVVDAGPNTLCTVADLTGQQT